MSSERNVRANLGASEPFSTHAVDGMHLAYNDEGMGAPIVCLHALGHGARDFEPFRARARARYRVLALDWPGHGRSSPDTRGPSVNRYADLLERFLDGIGIERAVLIGNSIGGGAAIRLAARHPARVRALVLMNPAGLEPIDVLARGVIAGMARFFDAGAAGARWFDAAFSAYYRLVLPRAPAHEHRARIVAACRESAPLLAAAWRSFADPAHDLRALGPEVSCPALFAWATQDRVVQLWRSRAAITGFKNVTIEEFPAGHCPHLEDPDAFSRTFHRFMDDIEASEKKVRLGS